jgi:hypothetical protein
MFFNNKEKHDNYLPQEWYFKASDLYSLANSSGIGG